MWFVYYDLKSGALVSQGGTKATDERLARGDLGELIFDVQPLGRWNTITLKFEPLPPDAPLTPDQVWDQLSPETKATIFAIPEVATLPDVFPKVNK